MIEFAHEFRAPVYIHAADRQWVARLALAELPAGQEPATPSITGATT